MHMCSYAYIFIYMYMHIIVCMCVCICMCHKYEWVTLHPGLQQNVRIQIHVKIHVRTYISTHASQTPHTHKHTHTRPHTYARTHTPLSPTHTSTHKQARTYTTLSHTNTYFRCDHFEHSLNDRVRNSCSSRHVHHNILIRYAEFVTCSIYTVCDSRVEFVTHVARDVYTTMRSMRTFALQHTTARCNTLQQYV